MVLRVRGGQTSKLEEIDEFPVPDVLDPPQIPQTIGLGQPAPARTSVNVTVPPPPKEAPSGAKGEAGPPGTPAISPPLPPGAASPSTVFPPWPYVPATPHAYIFRNTGWTVEVELTVAADKETVELSLSPEFVRLCGLENQSPNGEWRCFKPKPWIFRSGGIPCIPLSVR